MTPEQKFEFDLNGYTVIRNALTPFQIQELLASWTKRMNGRRLFDIPFAWGRPWTDLIDLPKVLPVLMELFCGRPRLDHAFAVTEAFASSGGRLHHQSDMFEVGAFYRVANRTFHCGLVGVSIALLPVEVGRGGFSCIRGSHKSNFPVPPNLYEVANNPLVEPVPQNPGDAIIFSEALTHGTWPASPEFTRRSIFMRYTPGHMAFRRSPMSGTVTQLPTTPNYIHEDGEGVVDPTILTDRQRLIACEPPYARDRRGVNDGGEK